MRKWLLLLFTANLLSIHLKAQTYLEPFGGFQTDLNNRGKFHQINTGVQFSFRRGKHYELTTGIQKSLGVAYHTSDSSFTPNPNLPLYSNANETIHPGIWYLSLDHRFLITGKRTGHQFALLLLNSLTAQVMRVDYNYDKQDYVILNPDKTQTILTLSVGIGVEYLKYLKNNRLFFRVSLNTPLATSLDYPSSFSFMVPFSVNAGYSILIKKKKHEE